MLCREHSDFIVYRSSDISSTRKPKSFLESLDISKQTSNTLKKFQGKFCENFAVVCKQGYIVRRKLGYQIKPGFQAPQESDPKKNFCSPLACARLKPQQDRQLRRLRARNPAIVCAICKASACNHVGENANLMLKTSFCKSTSFQASYFKRIVKLLWNLICTVAPPSSMSSQCQVSHFSRAFSKKKIFFFIKLSFRCRLSLYLVRSQGVSLSQELALLIS